MLDSMGDEEHLKDNSDEEDEVVSIWQPLSPVASRPEARPTERCGHVAVSSRNGKRLLIMGGYNGKGILSLRAVWEFDFETRAWSTLDLVDGPAPPERAYFRGCAGPPIGSEKREEREPFVYIYGGLDAEGDPSNDIWCLDVENRTWNEVQRGGNCVGGDGAIPSSRFNHAMCRMGGSLVVHGGELTSGSVLDDLCVFHPGTVSWSEVRISSGGPRPCPRSSHCIDYAEGSVEGSSILGSLVLFGGLGQNSGGFDDEGTQPLNDLWVLSPVTEEWLRSSRGMDEDCSTPVWSLVVLEGVGPSPRSLSALSPRPGGADLFLFGGYGLVEMPASSGDPSASAGDVENEGGDIIVAYVDDLWMLSLNGGVSSKPEWVDEEGMGFTGESIVEGRNGHTLTWCGDGKLVLFGGFVGDGFDASLHVAKPPPSTRAACA